jgi:hypothetical protein
LFSLSYALSLSLSIMRGHTGGITTVQFDDNRIVSGSVDRTAKVEEKLK